MLNVTQIRGNNQYAAAHYFSAADDYYTKDEHGYWQGSGAEALGLTGAVDRAEFARLLNGQLPNGERIQTTFDKEGKKRMGLDLTFSAPKSVSMQALIASDKDVTSAHDRAVAYALTQVEQLAAARKKVSGKSYRERTGNLVIGKFRHELSRAKDPQLHTHAIVLNMTRRSDGAWRALGNEDLYKVQHQIDAFYKAELAKSLQELGYNIRLLDSKGNFELAHIDRNQIESFSARSKVIEDALANQGKTRETATALEKQIIALATRPRKDERDRELVKQYWVERSRGLGIDFGPRSRLDGREYDPHGPGRMRPQLPMQPGARAQEFGNGVEPPPLPARAQSSARATEKLPTPAEAVVDYAIRHLSEREAVVTEDQLITTAAQRAVGLAGVEEVKVRIEQLLKQGTLIEAPMAYKQANEAKDPRAKALTRAGWEAKLREEKGWASRRARAYVGDAIKRGSLVETEKRFTTQKALKREKAILAIERDGRGKVEPIMVQEAVRTALVDSTLNAGQRTAVETIVATSNRFVGIQGDAGTGKTYAINQAIGLIQKAGEMSQDAGFRTVALAPYGNQVKALKNEGLEAHTLASFLHTKEKPIDARTIIVLDESGVVGARQMEQLMRVVEKAGARMVIVGDTKQTEAIEAGKPFAQLQHDGMQTARVSEIQRQKDVDLRTAVEHAAESRVGPSLAHIKHIEHQPDASLRHQSIVDDYVNLPADEREQTLIVAGTNAERRDINERARVALGLAGQGREFETLTRVDMTQAERRFAPSYVAGMVVQPNRDYAKVGLARDENYRVVEHRPGNELVLKRADGTLATINPRCVTQLSIYQAEKNELASGDLIRINRNDPKLDLTNGDRFRVAGTLGGVVKLASVETKDGRPVRTVELPATRPLHLEHAYASTVHSAQGLTNQRALIALNTKNRTTSMNLYYVAISRARYEARIYTNDVNNLPEAIARRFDKTAALSVQRERTNERKFGGLDRYTPSSGKSSLQRHTPADGKAAKEYGRF